VALLPNDWHPHEIPPDDTAGDEQAEVLLEEAMQALPSELPFRLPFQQVDRSQFMKEHEHEHPSAPTTQVFNISLVTQADPSRIEFLLECSRRWKGPIVAAIYLAANLSLHEALGSLPLGQHLQLLPLHAVAGDGAKRPAYPINKLRNMAIRAVRTTHYVVVDVDLWPSLGIMHAVLACPRAYLSRKYVALVVPAFQFEPQKGAMDESWFSRVPRTMTEMKDCLALQQCSTFYVHSSPETHSSTPYTEWWKADAGAEPLPIPCFKNARYEPYVILPNLPTTPLYSEAFTGYGKNKIELITHLRFAGFKFFALPDAFVVHMPHAKSEMKREWEAGPPRRQMDRLFQRLIKALVANYQRPRTPSCTEGRLL